MSEINYSKENSWQIKENLPIKVSVTKNGRYFSIQIPAMSMRYETAEKLGDNLKLSDELWGQRERAGYDNSIRKYQNDVFLSSYDYENGEATFTASTEKDVENWLKLHESYVVRLNRFN